MATLSSFVQIPWQFVARRVAAPVQVRGRQLDGRAAVGGMMGAQIGVEGEVIFQRDRDAVEVPPHHRLQFRGQACCEDLVIAIDKPVLIAHGKRVGDAHAHIAIGADHRLSRFADPDKAAGHPALEMLHGSDPRFDHLEGRMEGVEVEVGAARTEPGCKPQLERVIARPQLERGEPDVVVRVDEPGEEHPAR
jgi:hypothetical protein